MKESTEHLKWLINFARRDIADELKTIKKTAWMRLQEAIIAFASFESDDRFHIQLVDEESPYRMLTQEMALSFHKMTRVCINSLFSKEMRKEWNTSESIFRRIDGQFWVQLNPAKPGRLLKFETSFENLLNFRLGQTISTSGLSRIKVCSVCGGFFFANIGKKVYCSKRCINRVSRKKWLEDPKNLRKEREWAHQRYKTRTRAKVGQETSIKRRPRSTS